MFGSLVGFQDASLALELLYCVYATVATLTLAVWYQSHVPGGVSIPWQLATRLLVAGVNTYIHRAICLPRRRRQAEAAARAAAVTAAAEGPGSSNPGAGNRHPKRCFDPDDLSPSGEAGSPINSGSGVAAGGPSRAGDVSKHALNMGGQPTRALGPGMPVDEGLCKADNEGGSVQQGAPSETGQTSLAWVPYVSPLGTTAPGVLLRNAVAEGVGAAPDPPEPAVGATLVPLARRPLYRSCLQRQSVMLKVAWAEPSLLSPDWHAQLESQISSFGPRRLALATAEPGCIRLSLFFEQLTLLSPPGAELPSVAGVLEALGLERPADEAEPTWQCLRTLTAALAPDEAAAAGPQVLPAVTVRPAQRVLLVSPPSAGEAARALPRLRLALTMPEGLADGEMEVQVALRSRTGLLASRLVPVSSGGSTATVLREYDIELLEPPTRPGAVLLDVSAEYPSSGLRCALVPLLATADADLAAELAAAAEAWPEAEAESLDHVLYDMATWAAAMYDITHGPTGSSSAYPAAVLEDLTENLLEFAQERGWRVASERLAADFSRVRSSSVPTSAAPAAARNDADTELAVALAADPDAAGLESEREATERKLGEGSWVGSGAADKPAAPLSAPAQETSGTSRGADWRRALRLTLGLEAAPADEEEAFCESQASWSIAVGYPTQTTECVLLLALVAKGLWAGEALPITLFVAMTSSFLSTLWWLLLPRSAGQSLRRALLMPRYVINYLARLTLPYTPCMPGSLGYMRGPGMVLMEGVLLPSAIMVTPRTCAVLCLARLPFTALMLATCGVGSTWLGFASISARLEAASLLTTIALNTYLRVLLQQRGTASASASAHARTRRVSSSAESGVAGAASAASAAEAEAVAAAKASAGGEERGGGSAAQAPTVRRRWVGSAAAESEPRGGASGSGSTGPLKAE
ncbi:hypothetical protein HYH03_003163 [Edaphochlamys debaryana]|uniref:Uncharacterized protein n=1 Tax=Edaphochlamys debaryana TaxID=47281 RepID=A0A835YAD9_9CHLO|nr:hypothetical protein HYH03_003163 [Edaphochlamys debaryana]|eukprot:KAG2498976.1 hypothetical protein HYH03_003163 [Edaphochlamys debaryana]